MFSVIQGLKTCDDVIPTQTMGGVDLDKVGYRAKGQFSLCD